MTTVRRNYIVLILLGLVFAAPGISAYLFYTHRTWLSAAPTNKGMLLNPPVLLASLGDTHSRKWRLILWNAGPCEKKCIQQLDKLARVRLALGRRLYDVVPLLLLSAETPPISESLSHALQEQDIQVARLPVDFKQGVLISNPHRTIFIANPDHYLVLSYRSSVKPDDVFHDMKQLLNAADKVS